MKNDPFKNCAAPGSIAQAKTMVSKFIIVLDSSPLRHALCWSFVFLAAIAGSHAAVYSPRILSPHNADAYSLKTFADFPRWRDLQGDAKVFEIFKYLTDRRTGIYPMGVPAWEGNEVLAEYGAVTDPVKMLNVYPIGHCGTLGPTAAGILEGMGIGPARTLILPGWHHVAAEGFYEGKWHYLDLDVRAVFRRGDGSLASIEEAKTDASLWNGPNSPLFFPLDSLQTVREVYAKTPVEHRYGVASVGHTMDFVLRRGETFTRWWKPQEGRWNQHSSYASKPFPRNTLERAPRGPKCKHESFTIHTHGNGRFVYKPILTVKSADFEDGAYDFHNVEPGATGLTLKTSGEGYVIFEVHSPYVIVPLVGDLDSTADDREASIVTLDATGADLSLSLDNNLTWQKIGAAQGIMDLTSHVSGRYGYLLKIELRGEPGKAVVRALELTTWVQVHPASLPALRKGTNTMRLVTGDHYGLQTRVMAMQPDGGSRDDFSKHLVDPPKDYDPTRRTSRVRGAIVAKVPAPPGTKIAWLSTGASFAAQVGSSNKTRNSISYATGESRDFTEIYRAAIPPDQSHWHYNVDREVKLAQPAREIFVRYVGEPALNNIRIYAHCLEQRPRSAAPLVVTHGWSENGERKTKQLKLEGPGEYEIEVTAEPTDDFIEMAVHSSLRVAQAKAPGRATQSPSQGASIPSSLKEDAEAYFPPPESQGGWRTPEKAEDVRRLAGMDPAGLADLKQWLLDSDDRNFAAVVIRHGYVVLEVERGNSAKTDSSRVASVSKAICATVLAIASEQSQQGRTSKKMKFDDPAFQFIPWAQPLSDPRKEKITVRQLLNHTSGICPEATGARNDGSWEYILGLTGDARTARLAFDPGSGCGYSTHALAHAALVCEAVTGKPYDQFAIEALFKPIGIEHWWFQYYDGGEKYGRHPSHGMGMPARDLARVAYCMLRGGRWKENQVIPKWFVDETGAPTHTVKSPEMRWKLNAQIFSHGWELPARLTGEGGRSGEGIPMDARAKPGSGGQYIAFVPSLDLVLTRQTGSSGEWAFEEFLRRACQSVLGHNAKPN